MSARRTTTAAGTTPSAADDSATVTVPLCDLAEALAQLTKAATLRDGGDLQARPCEDHAREILKRLVGTPADDALPTSNWSPSAGRVSLAREALLQAISVADVLIGKVHRERHDESPLHLGLVVRVRELADAADLLLTEPDGCDEEDDIRSAGCVMFGAGHCRRAATGGAS